MSRVDHDERRGIDRLVGGRREKRELGFARGQIWIADDFDDTPEEIIEEFYR